LQRKRRRLIQDVRSAFLDIDLVKEGGLMHEPMDEWTFESRIYSKVMGLLLLLLVNAATNADMPPSVQCTVTQLWKPWERREHPPRR
jgi:hypothetical protein